MAIPNDYIDKITNKDSGESRIISPAADKVRVNNENFEGTDLDEVLGEVAQAIEEAGSGDGTVTGVKVGSTTYEPTDGVVDLSTPFGGKVDKENGKGLSTNDYSTVEKTKLQNLPTADTLTQQLGAKANDTDVVKSISVNGTAQTKDGNGNVNIVVEGQVGPQGQKGNSVVDGDTFLIINNLTEGGDADALSADMGLVLKRNIGILNDNIQAMMSALANLAFSSSRPTLAQLDWTALTHSVTLVTTGLSHCTASADAKVAHGGNLVITLSPDSGYTLDGVTPIVSASSGTASTAVSGDDILITVSNVTADVTVTISATATKAKTISLALTNCSCTSHTDGETISNNITVVIEADDRCELSADGITVTGGTASVSINADGSEATLEIAVTGDVEVTAAAADGQHIRNGLLFYLDGANVGSDSGKWTDRIAGIGFSKGANITVVNDGNNKQIGWYFPATSGSGLDNVMALMNNGAVDTTTELKYVSNGKLSASGTVLDMDAITIEVAYKTSETANKIFVFDFHLASVNTKSVDAPYYSLYSAKNYIKGLKNVGGSETKKYALNATIGEKTVSQSSARGISNGITLSPTGITGSDKINEKSVGGMWIGCTSVATIGSPSNYCAMEIYSIRIYNRILTEDEVMYNQWVDDQRYSMGLNLTKPAE